MFYDCLLNENEEIQEFKDFPYGRSNACIGLIEEEGWVSLLKIKKLKILDISYNSMYCRDNDISRFTSQSLLLLIKKLKKIIIKTGIEVANDRYIQEMLVSSDNNTIAFSEHLKTKTAWNNDITIAQLQYFQIEAPNTKIISNLEGFREDQAMEE